MEYNSSLPIYLQAANSIKQDIVTGKLSPGARLPSVRDLAVEYTINPNTVSRVDGRRLLYQTRDGNLRDRRSGKGAAAEGRDGRNPDPGISGGNGAAWLFQSPGNRTSGERTVGMTRSV